MQTAGGALAVLEEPQEIGRTEVEDVTIRGISAVREFPYETETKIYQAT